MAQVFQGALSGFNLEFDFDKALTLVKQQAGMAVFGTLNQTYVQHDNTVLVAIDGLMNLLSSVAGVVLDKNNQTYEQFAGAVQAGFTNVIQVQPKGIAMSVRILVVVAGCIALMFGCAGQPDETQQIVDNLVNAGFPADDIMVVDGKVYAGRDAEVSLAASREMLEVGDTTEEQYRTNNLVSTSLSKICINGATFTGAFSTALDLAIQNYNDLPLTFVMARTPSTGCNFTINAVIQPGGVGGSAGFPSGGLPYHTVNIGGGLSSYSVDVIEHVITHEIGHTLGFRHSDYYNRSISCGSGGDEGDAGIGAIHIAGTPTTATVGGSLMNSCFRSVETGEFSPGDITAMTVLYKQKGTAKGRIQGFYGKCLDADANGSGTNGARVQLWDCNGWDNQKWQLLADGTIRGVGGKCLDADANGSGANGTRLQLWDCYGWDNQKWVIGD